jgi:TATA-box binding protein (TBP) (component of TFIID and TFIIIB)
MQPTAFKISTITAISTFSEQWMDLNMLYACFTIVPVGSEGVVYVEYPISSEEVQFKGYHRKHTVVRRKEPSKKRFDSQVTILLYLKDDKNELTKTNVKIFKKGMVQLTGLKTEEQGHRAIAYIERHIRAVNNEFKILSDVSKISPRNFKICLINCDFTTGVLINRDRLDRIVKTQYGTFCSYEPCIYPPVKIQYFYNEEYSDPNGVCQCTHHCAGLGCGKGQGECKKISIMVFGSGCVIITGSQSLTQLDTAYEFICRILKKHAETIVINIPRSVPTTAVRRPRRARDNVATPVTSVN